MERRHRLIEELRATAPRRISGPSLAGRLGVSVRTIERDLAELVDAGVPICVQRGPEAATRSRWEVRQWRSASVPVKSPLSWRVSSPLARTRQRPRYPRSTNFSMPCAQGAPRLPPKGVTLPGARCPETPACGHADGAPDGRVRVISGSTLSTPWRSAPPWGAEGSMEEGRLLKPVAYRGQAEHGRWEQPTDGAQLTVW